MENDSIRSNFVLGMGCTNRMRIISFVSLQAEIKVYLLQIRLVLFHKTLIHFKDFMHSYGFRS